MSPAKIMIKGCLQKYSSAALFFFALLAIWQIVSSVFNIPKWLLPSPHEIAISAFESRRILLHHTCYTLSQALLGLGLSIVIAILVVVAMDIFEVFRRAIYPFLIISQTLPVITIAPMIIIWFGYGILSKIVIVALVCFFPIVVNTSDGMKSIDQDIISMLKTMGAGRFQILLKARLHAAMPGFFSGLRIAMTYCIIGAVIGEWAGAKSGLGVFMLRSSNSFLTEQVFAAIAIISFLSIFLFLFIGALEKILIPWHFVASLKGQRIKHALVMLIVAFALMGCASPMKLQQTTPAELTVMLDWSPNTNHTGLYIAKAKGWYEEQGLDVELVEPGMQGGLTVQLVAAGKSDFGISSQEEIMNARAKGVPVVSIAAIIQHNSSGFASIKSKNITRPRAFVGKKYGAFGSSIERQIISELMKCDGADPGKLEFVEIGSSEPLVAMQRDVDLVWIFYGWKGIEAELQKLPINLIMLGDWTGCVPDVYTPVIIAGEKALLEKKGLVKRFMSATAMGYQFAIDHPREAADIVVDLLPEIKKELINESQLWLSSRYKNQSHRWGEQSPKIWQEYYNWLVKHEAIDKGIDVSKAFTNEFLP